MRTCGSTRFCSWRDAHLVEGIALGEVGDRVHLVGGGVAGHAADRLQRDGDDGVARLLVRMRVARHPAIEGALRRTQTPPCAGRRSKAGGAK